MNLLKPYDYLLNQLHINYTNKQENFYNLMLTFYESNERLKAVSTLLDNPSPELTSLSAFDRQNLISLLRAVCNKDPDIHSVYIYKSKTQSLYGYSPYSNILQTLSSETPQYADLSNKEFRRTFYEARPARLAENAGSKTMIYGIGGNLNSESSSLINKPGAVMVAYDTDGLEKLLRNRGLKFDNRFMILSTTGDVIFDSSRFSYGVPANQAPDWRMQLVHGAKSVVVDGKPYYAATIMDNKRGYLSAYLVAKADVDSGASQFSAMINIGSFLFLGLSFAIYLLSTRFSTRRFQLLETAMTQIGSNNLTYRIPLKSGNDEFTAISNRFNEMCDELEDNVNKAYIYQLKQQSAELYALQTSINPHFLYNTLEAIRGRLVEDGNPAAAEMVVMLSKLYRNQIKGKMFITLREEINQCQMYLELFSLRHDNNLACTFQMPQEAQKFAIPKNTLQPVLENFLVHGMEESGNCVEIAISMRDDSIFITVEDNGRGIEPALLEDIKRRLANRDETSDSGFGLSNVNERLRIVFGPDYGLSIDNRPLNAGTVVTIAIRALSVAELEERYQSGRGGSSDA